MGVHILTAPHTSTDHRNGIFLAGGITDCPDWQADIIARLNTRLDGWTLYNPRRPLFPIHDPAAARAQIEWEFTWLRRAEMILFWFPCETLCPIVLYELGAWSMTAKPIFVGCHSEYRRAQDVVIQTKLQRPDVEVVDNLFDLVEQVVGAAKKKSL